jgi:hypothetical protein
MLITYPFLKKKRTYLKKEAVMSLLLLIIMLCISGKLVAQTAISYEQKNLNDSLTKPASPKSPTHLARAAIEFGAAEVLPWVFDKFLKKADYADISFKSVGKNLNPGSWTWDDDNFQTNQFGHPFHGSQFYNSFRSNGYTFWQSVPATIAGSYIWETVAENQPPSINDFINTSFGGIVLGEMTHRLANKLINNKRSGVRRQATEVLGFIINPTNGINRVLDGKWGTVAANSKPDSSLIMAEFDAGVRTFNRNSSNILHNSNFGWYGHVKILYGTPYEDYDTPFSNIAIHVEFGKDDSSKVNMVSVYGSLAGWELKSNLKQQQLLVLSANYDFMHNSAFFYGGQSVKLNLMSEYDITKKIKINTVFGTGPILLAAIPDPYLYLPHGRNYDYGPGLAINASGQLTLADIFTYSLNYRGGWTVTINGHPSHYFLHAVSSEASIVIIKGFSFSIESGYFKLHGSYQKYPDLDKNYPYLRLSTRYTVNF